MAKKYEVHPNQISKWKGQLLEEVVLIFERSNKRWSAVKKAEEQRDAMLKTAGKMKIEHDFLKKNTCSYNLNSRLIVTRQEK